MKTLGLCFLLVPVILVPGAFAQEQSKNFQISTDDAIVQLWNAHSDETEGARLEGDKLIISSDSDLNTCLYLRVYRVKREAKKSEVTVPSGCTTIQRAPPLAPRDYSQNTSLCWESRSCFCSFHRPRRTSRSSTSTS